MSTSDRSKILITAALPYANGYIHLGHLAGAYLPADIYARYQRLKGRDVLFVCGSDEHGVAITVTAEKESIKPRDVVDRYHPANKDTFAAFGMSFDHYSRTSIPLHHDTAQQFFREFHDSALLKKKEELQLYCEVDRMFLADRYVEGTCPKCGNPRARGDQCENCGSWLSQTDLIEPRCKICGSKPVVRATTHLYFPLGQFQSRLEQYVRERNERDGWKENVLRYCESWFKEGLEDRAVTRDLTWGVPVPVSGFEKKVIYVWFDAVLGYISASKEWAALKGEPDGWKEYWLNPGTKYVAFIGKDNIVFHCIVFPAMLMAWNDTRKEHFILPENVPANEFLNFEGQKFSKSRGWGIDVRDFLRFFDPDLLRYALAATLPESRDSDFYLKDFQARVNNELADILGNFINRTIAFTHKTFQGAVPVQGELNDRDSRFLRLMGDTPGSVGRFYEHYKFRDGVAESMNLARAANKYFNDSEPWKTASSDPVRCATALNLCLQAVRALSILIEPVIPALALKAWDLLNIDEALHKQPWDSAGNPGLNAGHRLRNPQILVSKVEDSRVEEMVRSLRVQTADVPQTKGIERTMITIDDFKKLDLRVAKIVAAERIEKSKKLLKLRVRIGEEERQVVAGIAHQYEPEKLVGLQVVVVANLEPALLMGEESQGMLLAVNEANGTISVITVGENVTSGSVVR
ncbi:MAG: methionine--tRNA ligase [Bacteroidota bacterium]